MKHIFFKQLKIQNFLSVGAEPVCVEFTPGLNIITGVNHDKEDRRNGVGKSTIADGIYFTLFGRTLRDIKNEHILHDNGSYQCACSLEIEVEGADGKREVLRIERTLNPSTLAVWVNSVDKTLDSIANTNQFICEYLSCTPAVFSNCVILTLNNSSPFMAQKKQDKRKFVESIFGLEVFSKMQQEAKTRITKTNQQYEVVTGKLTEIVSALNQLLIRQKDADQIKTNRKAAIKVRIEQLEKQKSKAQDVVAAITQKNLPTLKLQTEEKITQLQNEQQTKHKEVVAVTSDIASLNSAINEQTKLLNRIAAGGDSCIMCLRSLSEQDHNHLNQERDKIKESVKELTAQVTQKSTGLAQIQEVSKSLDAQLKAEREKIPKIEALLRELVSANQTILQTDKDIATLNNELARVDEEVVSFDSIISETQTKKKAREQEASALSNTLAALEVAKVVFSEEGVKALLIKRILAVLNERINNYLTRLDANCSCTFDEFFEETLVNDKGRKISYYNFSDAERKAIDLACLFTFIDLRRIQSCISVNFSLYDELLDTSLDEKGVDIVIDILRERVEHHSECVFIISHRKECTKFATGSVIFLEKKHGVTRRKVDFLVK